MNYRIALCLVLISCTSACEHNPPRKDRADVNINVTPDITKNIDPELLKKCGNIPKLESGEEKQVIEWAKKNAQVISDCRDRQSKLVDTLSPK